MNKRILITAIGSSSARTLIAGLKDIGYYVVGCDINDKEYLYEATLTNEFVKIPYYNDKNYLPVLEKIIDEYEIGCLLPLTDPEVDIIDKNREQFDDISLWMVSEPIVKLARNKKNLAAFMCCNFKENYISTVSDVKDVLELDFPVIAKPKNGRSSQGIEILEDVKCFEKKKDLFDENYLFQTFIKGDVYTVDVLRDNRGNVICLPRNEVIRNSSGLGLSVKITNDDTVINIAAKIAEKIDLYGCVNMEFLKKEDKFYLIEINPRCSGGIGFSQKSGYDFVGNLSACYEGKLIDCEWKIKPMVIVKNYSEFITE